METHEEHLEIDPAGKRSIRLIKTKIFGWLNIEKIYWKHWKLTFTLRRYL